VQDYWFAMVNRNQFYTLVENLWKDTMNKLLQLSEANPSETDNSFDVAMSKKILDQQMKTDVFRKTFKLWDEELIRGSE
jgi:hypothetical protein